MGSALKGGSGQNRVPWGGTAEIPSYSPPPGGWFNVTYNPSSTSNVSANSVTDDLKRTKAEEEARAAAKVQAEAATKAQVEVANRAQMETAAKAQAEALAKTQAEAAAAKAAATKTQTEANATPSAYSGALDKVVGPLSRRPRRGRQTTIISDQLGSSEILG